MIRVRLSKDEKSELEDYRGQASSGNSEKALMVLKCNEGLSAPQIAKDLKRHPHTVRNWLNSYINNGISGLDRHYSPGRSTQLRDKVKEHIEKLLFTDPRELGYQAGLWTVSLLSHHLKSKENIDAGKDTVNRALKDMGFTYKRSAAGVSKKAPGKEEKLKRIKEIVEEIVELLNKKDCEIFALDESHFSTEPYVIRGWGKKRWPPKSAGTDNQASSYVIWSIESEKEKILLEERKIR